MTYFFFFLDTWRALLQVAYYPSKCWFLQVLLLPMFWQYLAACAKFFLRSLDFGCCIISLCCVCLCVCSFTLATSKCNKPPYGTLHLPPFFSLSHKLTCILHPFFNSAQQEIVVKWRWLKSSPFPGGIQAVMNKGKKKYKIHLAAAQCKINPDRSAPACTLPKSNDCVCTTKTHLFSLHSNGPSHGSFQPCDHNLLFHTCLSAASAGFCANDSGQAHPTRRSIIHCSHFLRGIHFFQEVI